MKRLYFDWLVFSKLKTAQFAALKQYLLDNAHRFIIPFAHPHFKDSESSHNDARFQDDLETMTVLCEDQFMFYHDDKALARLMSPKEALGLYVPENSADIEPFDLLKVLEDLDKDFAAKGQPQYGKLMKESMSVPFGYDEKNAPAILKVMFPTLKEGSTIMDLAQAMGPLAHGLTNNKDRYIEMRDSIAKGGASLTPRTTNVSTEKAVEEIKDYLKTVLKVDSFREFIDNGYKHEKKKPDEMKWFLQAYQMLDMLGYKPDPLTKPANTVMNIRHDAEHAYYAQFCDYLVTDDKKFKAKAEVLYRLLDVKTKVVDPKDLIEELRKDTLPPPADIEEFVDQVVQEYTQGTEVFREKQGDGEHTTIAVETRLQIFDFFTHIICEAASEAGAAFQARKVFQDQPRFSYEKEVRYVLRQLITTCGDKNIKDLDALITELIDGDAPKPLHWISPHLFLIVEMEEELFRPTVRIFIFKQPITKTTETPQA